MSRDFLLLELDRCFPCRIYQQCIPEKIGGRTTNDAKRKGVEFVGRRFQTNFFADLALGRRDLTGVLRFAMSFWKSPFQRLSILNEENLEIGGKKNKPGAAKVHVGGEENLHGSLEIRLDPRPKMIPEPACVFRRYPPYPNIHHES